MSPVRFRVLAASVVVFSLAATGFGQEAVVGPEEPPAFLVLPYLQLPDPTGITVMWETNRPLPGRVLYGPTRDLGRVAQDARKAKLHQVRLKDLTPGSTYFYRVESGPLASEVFSFRAPPPRGTAKWRMAVYGDSRSNPATHRKVAEQVAKADVDLILHTGDIVLNGLNYASWRKEWFEPLGDVARRVPWVSTIGNHESDAANYFSYAALPGNEHYFAFDMGNARIICLDSNGWIEKGRDSKQYAWLREELAQPRDLPWTFAAFHHPLFSADAARSINPLRWDWAPLFLDPANRVDAVLSGHDHFYARCHRIGRVTEPPSPGVLFLTTAGGGAGLYRSVRRDYVAATQSVHHFSLFEFDGDRCTLSAIDLTGKVIDRVELSKRALAGAVPAEGFAAYEVEELRRLLRLAAANANPLRLPADREARIGASLRVPTHFEVPVSGRLEWQETPGWTMDAAQAPFALEPGQPLEISLKARVAPGAFPASPLLKIVFDPGRFVNRAIEVAPWTLAGPERIEVRRAEEVHVDGRLEEEVWQGAGEQMLLGLPPRGGRGDEVRLAADRDHLYVAARLELPADTGAEPLKVGEAKKEATRLVLMDEHMRVVLSDGTDAVTLAVSPWGLRYTEMPSGRKGPVGWRAALGAGPGTWSAEMAIPRRLVAGWPEVRVNVVHKRRGAGRESQERHLCPAYTLGSHPDRIPDVQPVSVSPRMARLVLDGVAGAARR